jgi:hypothetical protein
LVFVLVRSLGLFQVVVVLVVGLESLQVVSLLDYLACATQHLMAWGARTTVEKYSDMKLYISCTM